MTDKTFEPNHTESLFTSVEKGMEVIDSKGDRVGTVDDLYFGADADEMRRHGAGAATAPDPSVRDDDIVTELAQALFDDNNLPEEMRKRLINSGFLRISASGLFKSDRYVLPDQIARIHDDQVHLNVAGDGLLHR